MEEFVLTKNITIIFLFLLGIKIYFMKTENDAELLKYYKFRSDEIRVENMLECKPVIRASNPKLTNQTEAKSKKNSELISVLKVANKSYVTLNCMSYKRYIKESFLSSEKLQKYIEGDKINIDLKVFCTFKEVSLASQTPERNFDLFWDYARIEHFTSTRLEEKSYFQGYIIDPFNYACKIYDSCINNSVVPLNHISYDWDKEKTDFLNKAKPFFEELKIDYDNFKSISSILQDIHSKIISNESVKLKSAQAFGKNYEEIMRNFKTQYLLLMDSKEIFQDVYSTYGPLVAQVYPSKLFQKNVLDCNQKVEFFKLIVKFFQRDYLDIKNADFFRYMFTTPYLCSHISHFYFNKYDCYFSLEHERPRIDHRCHFYFIRATEPKVKYSEIFQGIERFSNLETICISSGFRTSNYKDIFRNFPKSVKFLKIFTELDQSDIDSLASSNLVKLFFSNNSSITNLLALNQIETLDTVNIYNFENEDCELNIKKVFSDPEKLIKEDC